MKLNFLIGSNWHTSLPAEVVSLQESGDADEVDVLIDFVEEETKKKWNEDDIAHIEVGDKVTSVKKGSAIYGTFGYVIRVDYNLDDCPIVVLWPTHRVVAPVHPSEIELRKF